MYTLDWKRESSQESIIGEVKIVSGSLSIRRIRLDGSNVVLDAEGCVAGGQCPSCGQPSSRIHDRYMRQPVDLPWRGQKARLVVTVRRFRCLNSVCKRLSFAEDLGPALPPYARRTQEATDLLVDLALHAGGEGGARLAGQARIPTSPDTLLRLISHLPVPEAPTPRVLGVDDLALRRRHSTRPCWLIWRRISQSISSKAEMP